MLKNLKITVCTIVPLTPQPSNRGTLNIFFKHFKETFQFQFNFRSKFQFKVKSPSILHVNIDSQWCLRIPKGWNVALCRLSKEKYILYYNVSLFLFRTKCINFPCKRHFINKMEGIINIVHISLQSKCSTCSRSCKNDQTCNNAYRKWRGSHNHRFTRYPTLKITIKIIMLETMKGLDTVGQCNFRPWILVVRNSKQMIIK